MSGRQLSELSSGGPKVLAATSALKRGWLPRAGSRLTLVQLVLARRSLSALVPRSHGRQGREREESRLASHTRTRCVLKGGNAIFSCWDADASHKTGLGGRRLQPLRGTRACAPQSACTFVRAGGRTGAYLRVRRRRGHRRALSAALLVEAGRQIHGYSPPNSTPSADHGAVRHGAACYDAAHRAAAQCTQHDATPCSAREVTTAGPSESAALLAALQTCCSRLQCVATVWLRSARDCGGLERVGRILAGPLQRVPLQRVPLQCVLLQRVPLQLLHGRSEPRAAACCTVRGKLQDGAT